METGPILDCPITGPSAWDNEVLGEAGGQLVLPAEAIAEIMAAAKLLTDNPLPIT